MKAELEMSYESRGIHVSAKVLLVTTATPTPTPHSLVSALHHILLLFPQVVMSQRLGSSLRRKVSETETQLLALHEAKLAAISGNNPLSTTLLHPCLDFTFVIYLIYSNWPSLGSLDYVINDRGLSLMNDIRAMSTCGALVQVMTSAVPKNWRLRWRWCIWSGTGWRLCPRGCTASARGTARSWPGWRSSGSSSGRSWSRGRPSTVSHCLHQYLNSFRPKGETLLLWAIRQEAINHPHYCHKYLLKAKK